MKKLNIWILLFILSFSLFSQEALISYSLKNDDQHGWSIAVLYQFPEGYHQTHSEDFFRFELQSQQQGLELGEIIYPEGIEEKGFIQYYDQAELIRPILAFPEGEVLEGTLIAQYQLCDDAGVCLFPKSTEIPFAVESSFLDVKNGPGLFMYILLAFLGGVLLNLMPCVLPLLSVKALSLVKQSNESKKTILLNSWSYAGGILFSMLVLALLVVLLQSSGRVLGWGFQFQSPVFVYVLTALIFIFSLSLFDLYIFQTPKVANRKNTGGLGGSFVTGIFAVLVATPCTAPFMGTAMGFAFSQPPLTVILLFSFLGLGFALPFILLGIFPQVVKKIPKPGNWMVIFKEFMGFLMLGTVIYLLGTLHSQIGEKIKSVLWTFLFVGLALWIFGKSQNPRNKKIKKWLLRIAAIAVFAFPHFTLLSISSGAALGSYSQSDEWVNFDPAVLEELREEQPVFLEFTADWCTTCKLNHRNVLDTSFRRELFEEHNVVYMLGDYTLADETIGQWLRGFQRAGVPFYAVYLPAKEEPIILPEILSKEILRQALDPLVSEEL